MSLAVTLLMMLGADAFHDSFARANAAYEAGDYGQAIVGYEKLVASSVADAAVFYDLGNAYYREGRLGCAIANYERALQLDPGLGQARENMDKALRDTQRNLARPLDPPWEQSLLFWHRALTCGTVRNLAILCWLAFWTMLALRTWKPIRYLYAAAAVLAILSLAFTASAWAKAHPIDLAVAVVDKAPVRFGMSDSETVRFELFDGDRVAVDRRQDGWARVTTVGGERGWTRVGNLVFVGPPYLPPPDGAQGSDGKEDAT